MSAKPPVKPVEPPTIVDLLKAYPWLAVILALSVLVTLWAATRSAPKPPEPAPAEAPAVEAAAPEPEAAEDAPAPPPVFAEPEAAPSAPPPQRSSRPEEPLTQGGNGAWRGGVEPVRPP